MPTAGLCPSDWRRSMAFELDKLVRPNIRDLLPYSSARLEYAGDAAIFLDANENSCGSPVLNEYARYPDPLQRELKVALGELIGVNSNGIFVGNGSDEAIDLLIRAFCRPGIDNVIICPPTYGMYEVAAALNDVFVRQVSLTSDLQLDIRAIRKSTDANTKLIFVCSPNNPTGNLMDSEALLKLASDFDGIVVLDEAYIHFAGRGSMVRQLSELKNIVVLQTFSKAWGLAGLRVGVALADAPIIDLLTRIKLPYNISGLTQDTVMKALAMAPLVEENIARLIQERRRLADGLEKIPIVLNVYSSDANFLLCKFTDAQGVYQHLLRDRIVVRDRSSLVMCDGCLRITVGTPEETDELLRSLKNYEKSTFH